MNKIKSIFQTNQKELFDSAKTIFLAVFIALIFRYSVASPYKIPTGSMIPTLKKGDFIFVSKMTYGLKIPFTNINFLDFAPPKRGDVIVFIYPEDKSLDFIKRVIGVPGDRVEIRNNVLYLNDKMVERSVEENREILEDLEPIQVLEMARLYREKLNDQPHYMMQFLPFPTNYGPVEVPKDHLLVMGDNRDNSKDGRAWGFLPMKDVRGRALFIWFSWDSDHWRIRWDRLGQKIH